MMNWPTRLLDVTLQAVTLTLTVSLAVVVLLGIAFRYSGNSLIWYDEVASVLLAWITFTGAALATVRNAHLGFNGLLFALPPRARMALFAVVEAVFVITIGVIGWAGWAILDVFGNDTLVTLRFVPRSFVQGVLPLSAAAMILGRLFTLPGRTRALLEGVDPESEEIAAEIARADQELSAAQRPGGSS